MRNGLVGLWSLVLLGVPAAALAQAPAELPPSSASEGSAYPRHVLSLNPLGYAVGFYAAEYEVALAPRVSIAVQPGVSHGGGNSSDTIAVPSGPYLSGGVRFFLLGEAPTGLFVSPGFHALLPTFWSRQEERLMASPGRLHYGADVLVGGAWRLGSNLYLSGGLGAMYTVRPPDSAGRRFNLLLPTARANVGYAF